jgi:membrane-associated phospholipid phosphatase
VPLDPLLVLLVGLLTQLGAAWVVVGLGTLLIVVRPTAIQAPERVGWVVIGLTLAAFGAAGVLKPLVGAARPPGAATASIPAIVPAAVAPTVEWAVTGRGFGFPSGHVTVATAGYGGLAVLLNRDHRANPFGEAAAVVALVAATRLLLGVHRPADVVAGVVVGVATLGLVLATAGADRRFATDTIAPRRALAVAVGLSGAAVAVSFGTGYAHGVRTALLALGVASVALVGAA